MGLLIHTASGRRGGAGALRTNRPGCAGVGAVQHCGAGGDDLLGPAVVDVGGSAARCRRDGARLYQPKKAWQNARRPPASRTGRCCSGGA